MGRSGYGGGGRGRLYTDLSAVTTRMIPTLIRAAMRAILMFHNCEGQSHKTVSTDHNLWRERRAEADSNPGPSAYKRNTKTAHIFFVFSLLISYNSIYIYVCRLEYIYRLELVSICFSTYTQHSLYFCLLDTPIFKAGLKIAVDSSGFAVYFPSLITLNIIIYCTWLWRPTLPVFHSWLWRREKQSKAKCLTKLYICCDALCWLH